MQQLQTLLQQHDLSDWWPILSQWLPNFDGWRATIEADEDPGAWCEDGPATEVIERLRQYSQSSKQLVSMNTRVDDLHFARDISHFDFMRRRARLTLSGRRWNSFEESYGEFSATEPGEVPHVFEHDPHGASVTMYWLLGRLFELRAKQVDGHHAGPAQFASVAATSA